MECVHQTVDMNNEVLKTMAKGIDSRVVKKENELGLLSGTGSFVYMH